MSTFKKKKNWMEILVKEYIHVHFHKQGKYIARYFTNLFFSVSFSLKITLYIAEVRITF
jgi:hypothetical protein